MPIAECEILFVALPGFPAENRINYRGLNAKSKQHRQRRRHSETV
jgi:hypothetical protein